MQHCAHDAHTSPGFPNLVSEDTPTVHILDYLVYTNDLMD